MAKSEKQLELFKQDLNQVWSSRDELGRLYYDVYSMKFFVYSNQGKNIKPLVKRTLKLKNKDEFIIKLTPTIIPNEEKLEYRYLGSVEEDIFNYILWKASQHIADIPVVYITLKEINEIFKYDFRTIKNSLILLSNYKATFETKEYEGTIPNQFLEDVVIERGRGARTYIKLSNNLYEFIKKNKYVLMNYIDLFKLKSPISKILFKRINITNIFNYDDIDKVFYLPETMMTLLRQYGIDYTNRLQKSRLFKQIEIALDELRENNIIKFYELKKEFTKEITKDNHYIIVCNDLKLILYLTDEFVKKYSMYQKIKPLMEREQSQMLLESLRK